MEGKVVVYDSLPMQSLPEELNKQLRKLYGKDGKALDVSIPEVQKQSNQIDCGCFAIAWAVLHAIGERPENITLNKKQLRPHLLECLQKKSISPFPYTIKRSHRMRTKNITLM